MIVITFAAIKGGVGKTTLSYNLGVWLANQGKKILFIDLDSQSNLTSQMSAGFSYSNNVGSIFADQVDEVNIKHINDQIDIISGDLNIDKKEQLIETKSNKNMILYKWFSDNYDKIEQYDYVIIDTHPDFGTVTVNALITSDLIVSPIIPNKFSADGKENLISRLNALRNEMVDFKTGESFITAELLFLPNMIKTNTTSSKDFIEKNEGDDQMLDSIPYREIFNKATNQKQSIFDIKTYDDSSTMEQVETAYANILKVLE